MIKEKGRRYKPILVMGNGYHCGERNAELRKKRKGGSQSVWVTVSYGVRSQVPGARSPLGVKSFAFQFNTYESLY